MKFSALVKSRLAKLGHGQNDLARAAQVTDSYISQLLGARKVPPGRERTDIYPKMEAFLQLAPGELGRLAEIERTEELKRRLGRTAEPMFQQFRDLILGKCVPEKRVEVYRNPHNPTGKKRDWCFDAPKYHGVNSKVKLLAYPKIELPVRDMLP